MNRFVSASLAGAVAVSAVAVSATAAGADPWDHHRYYDRGSDVGPAIVGGAILGLAVGSMLQSEPVYPAPVYVAPAPVYVAPPPVYVEPPPPPPVYAYDSDAHFQWCASTYSTYNGETDTWIDYRGVPHRCISP